MIYWKRESRSRGMFSFYLCPPSCFLITLCSSSILILTFPLVYSLLFTSSGSVFGLAPFCFTAVLDNNPLHYSSRPAWGSSPPAESSLSLSEEPEFACKTWNPAWTRDSYWFEFKLSNILVVWASLATLAEWLQCLSQSVHLFRPNWSISTSLWMIWCWCVLMFVQHMWQTRVDCCLCDIDSCSSELMRAGSFIDWQGPEWGETWLVMADWMISVSFCDDENFLLYFSQSQHHLRSALQGQFIPVCTSAG